MTSVVDELKGKRILVAGDLMLDEWIYAIATNRFSPEAKGAPIYRCRHRWRSLGGAGNVAVQAAALGCEVQVAGVVGDDFEGTDLIDRLETKRIDTNHVMVARGYPTVVKTRLMDQRQILRIDQEQPADEGKYDIEDMLAWKPEAVIISDYGKGALPAQVTKDIVSLCREQHIPVVVDPYDTGNYWPYVKATVITPNVRELCTLTAQSQFPHEAAMELIRPDAMIVTMGQHGLDLVVGDHKKPTITRFPAAKEIEDPNPCGAGDTVAAVVGACLAAGMELGAAAYMANVAAALTVQQMGCGLLIPTVLADMMQHQPAAE